MLHSHTHLALLTFLALCVAQPLATRAAPGVCEARSPVQQALLVELYTSEGCSSCPPADRWLSSLKAQPAALAAAFHVTYWDRLGWPDRFAHASHTERQSAQMQASGARYVYTPQVLVNGRDWRGWPTLPLGGPGTARAQIHLQRSNDQQVVVSVSPGPGAPPRLALWWALLEDGHGTSVQAGENRGEQLRHDHVVRHYAREPAWAVVSTVTTPQRMTLAAPTKGEGGRMARLLVVVTDAATGSPLQAAQLQCPAAG